jgi:WD40 repeat protein
VRSVHFSTGSDLLVTGCRDRTARVFSVAVKADDPIVAFSGLRDAVHAAKFFNDDKELLVAYSDAPGLGVLDVRTGVCCAARMCGIQCVCCAAFMCALQCASCMCAHHMPCMLAMRTRFAVQGVRRGTSTCHTRCGAWT